MRTLSVMLAFALFGCSPPNVPLRPLESSTTTSAHESGHFTSHDGLELFEQSWHPSGPARAVLVVHHGLKDHSDRYGAFAERLTKDAFAVYAFDMRGHGRSAGERATIDSFDDLLDDLDRFMARVRQREPNAPIFLLGHSVGGAVVTLYAIERKPRLAGLVVLAPAIRVARMPLEAAATPVVASLFPNLPVVDVPDSAFVRLPEEQAAMASSPFIYHPSGPARTAAALLSAIERVWAGADDLDVPLLGLHGTDDKATDPRGTLELDRRVKNKDHTLLLYRGVRHDLLHEPEKEQIMQDLEKWLVAHAP
jgi:alpha-beta hydrolase superfamily lysophospholipase